MHQLWHHRQLELPPAVPEMLGGGPEAGWAADCKRWFPLTYQEHLGGLVRGGEQEPPQGEAAPAGSVCW